MKTTSKNKGKIFEKLMPKNLEITNKKYIFAL